MTFEEKKKLTLSWQDNSKKGSIDIQIKPLLDEINKLDNFYTTSSCAGRIAVIALTENKRKDEAQWLFVSHDKTNADDILNKLKQLPKVEVWYKMESAIIHVCPRTIDDALLMLGFAKEAGFKHSGILSIGKRIILEIYGSEKIETIIAKEGNMLVTNDYINELTSKANEKLKETRKRVKKLKNILASKSFND